MVDRRDIDRPDPQTIKRLDPLCINIQNDMKLVGIKNVEKISKLQMDLAGRIKKLLPLYHQVRSVAGAGTVVENVLS